LTQTQWLCSCEDVVHRGEARVMQRRGPPGLLQEIVPGHEPLDRHRPSKLVVVGEVDLAHSPGARSFRSAEPADRATRQIARVVLFGRRTGVVKLGHGLDTQMAFQAASALTRPAPVARSGPCCAATPLAVVPRKISVAFAFMTARICAGVCVGSFCTSRAATPATCAVAADVAPSLSRHPS